MASAWRSAFRRDNAVWGEYQGSAAAPYTCAVDLEGPAFRCSCPSRRVPCKHALDLFTRASADPMAFPEAEQPDWVSRWIGQRQARSQKSAAPADPERAAADQRRRAERREQRINGGIEELDRWLRDLVRGGLAEVPGRPRQSFDQMAARLVDAQAPGLARLVRELGYLPHSGDRWPERMLIVLGRLQLLLDGWRRIDAFEPDMQAELRAQVGIAESRESVLTSPPVRDRWSVLGRRLIVDERFQIQRTWLWGQTTGRWALVLDFAAGSQPLPPQPAPGAQVEADLHFYSGCFPLRAIFAGEPGASANEVRVPAVPIRDALVDYARALARNPWLERFPMMLADVTPRGTDTAWSVLDGGRRGLPLAGSHGWRLLAIAGGRPIHLFAEWDGYALHPLAAVADGTFTAMPTLAA
jgi:hypothetical protein